MSRGERLPGGLSKRLIIAIKQRDAQLVPAVCPNRSSYELGQQQSGQGQMGKASVASNYDKDWLKGIRLHERRAVR